MLISTDQLEAAAATASGFSGRDCAALADSELLAAVDAVSLSVRASQALLAQLAGEVEARSNSERGTGFAKRQGFGSAPRLIAKATGGSLADARRLVEAGSELSGPAAAGWGSGRAVDGALTLDGEPASGDVAPHTPLAQALAACEISVPAAALIRQTLREARAESPHLDTLGLEQRLVRKAPNVTLGELANVCMRERARHDVAAWERREQRQYEARCASITTDGDGMVVFSATLPPPLAAPVKKWFEAYVGAAFQRGRDPKHPELRKPAQIRADGLVDLANHALGCDSPVTGVKTTVVVRVTLEELQAGYGLGECDSVDGPISVGTLRTMLADAQVIPVVLGADSAVLDLGRFTRLFTPEQKIALGERDGGCAWCLAPPGWCDAHHIRWWERDCGPTDLDNGVLLCRSCHTRIHNTKWTIQVSDGLVWFIPPPGEGGEPVLGGRARLECE